MEVKIVGGKIVVVDGSGKQVAGPFNTPGEANAYVLNNGAGGAASTPGVGATPTATPGATTPPGATPSATTYGPGVAQPNVGDFAGAGQAGQQSEPLDLHSETNLSEAQILKAVKEGSLTAGQGYEALRGKGKTDEEATIILNNAGIAYSERQVTGSGPTVGGSGSGGGTNPADVGAKPYSFSEARDFVKNGIWTKEVYDAYVEKWETDPNKLALEQAKLPRPQPSALDPLANPTQFKIDPATFGQTSPFDTTPGAPGGEFDLENSISGQGQDREGVAYARDPVTGQPRVAGVTINGQHFQGNQLQDLLRQRKVYTGGGGSLEDLTNALDADLRIQSFLEGINPDLKAGQYQKVRNQLLGQKQSYHDASTGQLNALQDPTKLVNFFQGGLNTPAFNRGGTVAAGRLRERLRLNQAPRYADGGSLVTDEPIIGVGAESGMPRFEVGEEAPELLNIVPLKDGKGSVQKPDRAKVLRALAQQTSKRVKLAMPVVA